MIYLDTGVAIPLFVLEPSSGAVETWFASLDDKLVSSDWILTEVASALSIKVRRAEIVTSQAAIAWRDFEKFSLTALYLKRVSETAFRHAARLVRIAPSGLRSGDSLHLAMAIETGASAIATADRNLTQNAKISGFAVALF